MQTRSSSRLVSNPSSNPAPSTNLNPKGRNRRRSKQRIEEFNLEEHSPPIVMMAYQPQIWLEKEPTRSIFTWDDLVSKFINQFFPHSKTTNLRKEITNFQQRFDESFSEACDRFKDLLRACPYHGFSELYQLDTFYNALNSKDQDSLHFAAGGNILDKMPRECLAIIESKSKVRYSRSKPIVAKVSTNTSTSDISPDVAKLNDMVKALILDKKNQNQAPAIVKAVKESCVTCGSAHSYCNCPATDGNVYRDNIQEFVSQASVVNYNQENTIYQSKSGKQFQPWTCLSTLGFPTSTLPSSCLSSSSSSNTKCFEGDFSAYAKANDPVMRNMQTQGQNMQNQLTNLTELLTKFVNFNSASTSSSGTLPSNTITNPRSDLKDITTRSGVSYDGPQILPPPSFLPNVVENEPEATKDIVHPTNNRSTEDVQPLIVQSESLILTFELVNSPIIEPVASLVSAPRPNQRPSIPYPSRLQDQKLLNKANDQPSLLTNKDKLCELARTPLNEHCSVVLLKKLLEKLGDPGKFLILCDFLRKAECLALADLGASINLMPLSMLNKLSLPNLSPMCMTLELADRLISRSVGVAEDVNVKVGTFHFPADFVVVDFDADPRIPLILERSFRKTRRALIDVFEEYSQEVLGFSDVIASGNPTPYYDPIVSTTSLTLTPFRNSNFLLEEVDTFLALEDDPTSPEVELKDLPPHLEYAFLEGNDKFPVIIAKYMSMEEKTIVITVLKSHKRAIAWKLFDIKGIDPEFFTHKILMEEDFEPAVQHQRRVNPKIHDVIKQEFLKLLDAGLIYPISDSPWVIPVHCWRVCIDYRKVNEATSKDHFPLPFMDQMLERLAGNQYYCFLDVTFQRCMMAIFHDMIEKTMEVFIDDFLVFRNYFQSCLSHLEKMLKRCEDTNLCLNWEKSRFMVKEGIVLGHKISKEGIEVDKAKVDVITKLPHPTTVKVLGQRQDKHFRPIHYASKTMTEAESNYTTTEKEILAVVYAFEKFRSYLIMNKSIVYTDHSALKYLFAKKDLKARLLRWVLILQEFTFKVIDTKGAENLATDHIS
nr:hypothetical protein [Tanacetum cinerariifolium]